jgi:hypothetical protein
VFCALAARAEFVGKIVNRELETFASLSQEGTERDRSMRLAKDNFPASPGVRSSKNMTGDIRARPG